MRMMRQTLLQCKKADTEAKYNKKEYLHCTKASPKYPWYLIFSKVFDAAAITIMLSIADNNNRTQTLVEIATKSLYVMPICSYHT